MNSTRSAGRPPRGKHSGRDRDNGGMTKRITDIAGEGILLAGGARAILLQLANPAVGRGVAEHSDFARRPLQRLRNTLTYIYVVVYGSPGDLDALTRLVDTTHATVRGASYDARDPQLQLWVAATLYDTAITLYEQVYGPLGDDDADAIYRDYERLGSSLQMPEDLWPSDRAAFASYWADAEAKLSTDPATLAAAHDVLQPKAGPIWLRAGMPLARLITASLLTPDQRAMFDLPWNQTRQRRYTVAIKVIAAVYPRVPDRLRQWPKNYYLAQFARHSHSAGVSAR